MNSNFSISYVYTIYLYHRETGLMFSTNGSFIYNAIMFAVEVNETLYHLLLSIYKMTNSVYLHKEI